ncbi:MAG: YigZ family protein [Thermotogota bacterium]
MKDAFRTLATSASAKLVRQRSRFIALLEPITSVDAVHSRLSQIRRVYHDASHCCSAFRLVADPAPLQASDDDGEPTGSAGAPILLQLEGARLENVLAVVVRYFGGVKLGVGGLARAYSDVIATALASASIVERALAIELVVRFPLEANAGVMGAIYHHEAKILDIRYDTEGQAIVTVAPSRVEAFCRSVTEGTGARAQVEVTS